MIGQLNEDSTSLMIATDVGCYYSYNDGINWNFLGSEMPVVSIYEIYYDQESNTLFAGTYGRGAWKIQMPRAEPPNISIEETLELNITISPNPISDIINISTNQNVNGASLNVYNISGEKVFISQNNSGNNFSIPANNLAAGNYFVELKIGEKRLVKKLVKA